MRGATVPPTLPEALTWGNKFPTGSAPALFLPLPSTPKGPTLKKAGWGWGPQLISVGSEKRGAILNSLTFLFQFLSFVKVWALGFSRFVLYVKGRDLDSKGLLRCPHSCVSCLVPAPGHLPTPPSTQFPHHTWCCPWALLVILREGNRGCSDWRRLASFPPFLDSPVQRAPCTSAPASSSPPHPQPLLEGTVTFLFCLIRQYPC